MAIKLSDDVKKMKGVGAKKAEGLKRLKIETVEDFLFSYPREYEDRRELRGIASLAEDETALIRGRIQLIVKGKSGYGPRRSLNLLVADDTGSLEVVFFHAAYLEKTLSREVDYEFFGKVTMGRSGRLQMAHPSISKWDQTEGGHILPIYPLTLGIRQSDLRRLTLEALSCVEDLEDYIPVAVAERNRLCPLKDALNNIHFPSDRQSLMRAKFRLVFDELFLLQVGLLQIKKNLERQGHGILFDSDGKTEDFLKDLPFPLTGAQQRVIGEIERDMERQKVMNRLVEGDVGSGKTIVAAAAVFKAVKSGYQAVLMAPTELLARQHREGLSAQFASHGIRTGFLSGSLSAKEKRETLQRLSSGDIDLLIGTHAVIQKGVVFSNLGLVITDEQHRFGVNQREQLSQKGDHPDVLVMTATPIPRTLAVILYGDLDISVIDEMPPGRQKIITRAVDEDGREAAYEFVRRQVKEGRQAYIVAPLIEESLQLEARSATGLYEERSERFEGQRVALLHGEMNQTEKDRIMQSFYDGMVDVLISTVVIEVGINVPNATVMLIENAERFGLAQLHQLRGRVGRGTEQSYCILVTQAKTDYAKQRAEIMKQTSDGFVIAEKDLELRGPGEFFGVRQHGLPELRLADLSRHQKILQTVRNEAELLLEEDPKLSDAHHKTLLKKIKKTFESVENPRI